ncbi:conserved hypothetical protein [Arthrobacter sp. Hiyo8]|nr:conserved hypothetical protein [Arthrobacter sp. Hiyo8]
MGHPTAMGVPQYPGNRGARRSIRAGRQAVRRRTASPAMWLPETRNRALRPLFFGEIMDGAFQTVRRNAKTMFGSALIVQAVAGALNEVAALGMLGMVEPPVGGFTSQDEAMRYLGPAVGATAGIMGISLLTMVLTAVLQGVMAIPVARSALNRPTGFKQMWSLARSRIWPLVGLAALLLAGSLLFFLVLFLLAVLVLAGLGPAGVLLLFPLVFGAAVVFFWIYTKLLVARPPSP